MVTGDWQVATHAQWKRQNSVSCRERGAGNCKRKSNLVRKTKTRVWLARATPPSKTLKKFQCCCRRFTLFSTDVHQPSVCFSLPSPSLSHSHRSSPTSPPHQSDRQMFDLTGLLPSCVCVCVCVCAYICLHVNTLKSLHIYTVKAFIDIHTCLCAVCLNPFSVPSLSVYIVSVEVDPSFTSLHSLLSACRLLKAPLNSNKNK